MLKTFIATQPRRSGPCHHKSSEHMVDGNTRLDTKSAGLSLVGTCLHSYDAVNDCISATRLLTNVFKLFGGVFSHANTILESDQNINFGIIILLLIERSTLLASRAATSAPHNSSLGVKGLNGATLNFAHNKFTWISPYTSYPYVNAATICFT